jgi:hypothetical protein
MSSRVSWFGVATVRRATVVALLVAAAGGAGVGCHPMIALETPIVVRQSDARELTILNATDKPIAVLPAADRPGEPKLIPAGGRSAVPFRLEEIARLERLDPTPRAKDPRYGLGDTVTTLADPDSPAGPTYVALRGVDGVVRIQIGDREHDFLIGIQDDCVWQAPPPGGFVLEVSGPPTAGLPERLCED